MGGPRVSFYIVVALVVLGLVVFAMRRADIFAPKGGGDDKTIEPIDKDKLKATAEAPDGGNITTVKEYTFTPAQRLPPVKGTAAYHPLKDNTVVFALNVWAGWAPIIQANNGFKAGKIWKTPDGEEFKVELRLIDNPIDMREAYNAGDVHIGWATLDMMPLFMDAFVDREGNPRDSRVMPRVYQQVDWSNGGDGIVVRDDIKTVLGLRGKKIALAQNSPSHYFLLNMLVAGGLQPSEVQMVFTKDAFEAAAAFNGDRSIAGCVSWAPDIYKLADVKGNRMLVTTGTANKMIADVWFARADFAKDHPGKVEALVRGIFDAMVELKQDKVKGQCAELMAAGYGIKATEALGMLGDAHSTNWAENYQFFMNENNPTNFQRVWEQAYYLYRHIRTVTNPSVSFDQVMDYSIIAKLGKEAKYSAQKDDYSVKFAPKATMEVRGEKEILTNTVVIHFFPNSWDLHKSITHDEGGKTIETLYDPKVDLVLGEIGKLAGQFGNARIIIEGHTDSSMQGRVPAEMVKELSLNRANAVKEAIVQKFKLDQNRFNVDGLGWDRPADESDPQNNAKNRRVEVKVYAAEQQ
jgi:ABC-type nitrate/sulfonate/bicarbonate transport system substrate-binding protein/outer membrane protein OmpA-like peptidoglycan-associated protein